MTGSEGDLRAVYRDRIESGLLSLREGIAKAAGRSGREAGAIEIVAVTKFHPQEAVEAALDLGLRRFAENRVQEAEDKYAEIRVGRADLRLDLIGHLQGNKAKRAVALFDRIQSIDSLELIQGLLTRAAAIPDRPRAAPLEILFELHTAEESKTGFPDADSVMGACDLLAKLGAAAGLKPRGLMTMAPFGDDEVAIRRSFSTLRNLRERMAREFALPDFDVLSMGMSGDYGLAVEEGATEIRIGTALFGERRP